MTDYQFTIVIPSELGFPLIEIPGMLVVKCQIESHSSRDYLKLIKNIYIILHERRYLEMPTHKSTFVCAF